MKNSQLIERFYYSFSKGDIEGMLSCYHSDIVFEDPAFGILKGERAFSMWKMLLSNQQAETKITFNHIEANTTTGSAIWIAQYVFGRSKRKVINRVNAQFMFQEGKIIKHSDTFNLWKWSGQALGPMGYLFGWTSFMEKRIQLMANKKLDDFMMKHQ